jgi:hypothetical protein
MNTPLRNFHEKGNSRQSCRAPRAGAASQPAHGHHAPLSKRHCHWKRFAVTGRRATENLAAVSYVAGNVDDVTGMDDVVGQMS